MSASPSIALLVLAFFGGAANAAEPSRLPDCDTAQERIDLPAEPTGRVYEICISPGLGTMIVFFAAELLRENVTLEGSERFTVVATGTRSLSLLPSENVVPGERLKLTVRFADGEAPTSANFILVVHPARAVRQVEVFRQKRTLASYQRAEKEAEAQVQQCHEENARLRTQCGGPHGLTGLLASKFMDRYGIASKDTTHSATRHPTGALSVESVFSYRANGLVAVELSLKVPIGESPWIATGAELVGLDRHTLRVLPPWQSEPSAPDGRGLRVVIEAEATEQETRGDFTLKLWNEDGTRRVVVSGVTFP